MVDGGWWSGPLPCDVFIWDYRLKVRLQSLQTEREGVIFSSCNCHSSLPPLGSWGDRCHRRQSGGRTGIKADVSQREGEREVEEEETVSRKEEEKE